MDPPQLRVRMLGALELRLGDQRLAPLESARVESLLGYLLLHRDAPQSRRRVAFLLWPDSTEAQARTNLRKVVHHLRRALPDADRFIEVGPRTLGWRADAPLWLDVDLFERALREGRWEEAVRLYAGELLEGHYDEWLTAERERFAGLYMRALERLAREHEGAEAISYAERLVAADPLREASHRLLIQLYAAVGDRPRALRAYHACALTLERELGVEPAAETRALYEALGAVAGGPAAGAPLIGRDADYQRLGAIWRAAAAGAAQLAIVSGEAGIGKTRLVDELRARTNAVALEARSYPAEGAIAYGVATAWLRSEPVLARLDRLDPAQRTELARLAPELAPGAPEPLPESELRRRLFAALAQALLGAGAPLLLIADDIQWADAQSLQFIHYLLRAAPAARLLVAATVRREDVQPPLTAVITALQGRGRAGEIALARLDREQIARLAESLTGTAPDAVALAQLYESTEGNPLFVVEALRPDAPAGAERVQAVIAGRMAQLSVPSSELVGVAASIGRAFTADVLAAAAGLDEAAFVQGLDELWRRGLVRAQGPSGYDFSHGRIRDAAYAALGPARRRQTHLAIARALERSGSAAPAALALHYERAGATAEAVRWHARAAEAAQWLHAHADAVVALERALALCEQLPPGPDTAARQLQLLSALPAPLLTLEGYGSARMTSLHARATTLADRLGAELGSPLVWSLAMAALVRGDWTSAEGFGRRLRARAQRDDDPVLLVESDYLEGIAAYWPGRLDDARAHFEAAMERFRPERRHAHVLRYGQDPELLVRLRLAHTHWLLGCEDEADHQRDLALAVAQHSPHAYSRAVTLVWAAILAMERGDTERLDAHVRTLRAHLVDDAPAQIRLAAEALAGYVALLRGRAEGLARVRAVHVALARGDAPAPGLPGVVTRILLAAYALAGEPRAGLALADEALAMGRGAELFEPEIRRLRAIFLADLQAPHEAELERALAAAERQGARTVAARVRGTLAERTAGEDRR